jgi:hypothetical protein
VLFVTAKSDKTGACREVNAALAEGVKDLPNVRLFDWQSASEPHPELFYRDKTHLRPAGGQFYARSLLAEVNRQLEAKAAPPSGEAVEPPVALATRQGEPPATPFQETQSGEPDQPGTERIVP